MAAQARMQTGSRPGKATQRWPPETERRTRLERMSLCHSFQMSRRKTSTAASVDRRSLHLQVKASHLFDTRSRLTIELLPVRRDYNRRSSRTVSAGSRLLNVLNEVRAS